MSIDKEKREEIGILLGYLDGATGTSLCREAAATIRYLMENITSTAMNNPIGWPTAQCICDIPEVHEALEAYSEDSTDDNAVALVCAALNAASAAIRNAAVDEQLVIEAFLKRSGQYVTNDASREAAIAEAVNAALEKAAQMVEDYQAEAVPVHFSTVASDIRALQSSPAPKQDEMQSSFVPPQEIERDNMTLRRLLMFRIARLPYCDDGEMQDNSDWPYIDFKRDSVSDIVAKLTERGRIAFEKASQSDAMTHYRSMVSPEDDAAIDRAAGLLHSSDAGKE